MKKLFALTAIVLVAASLFWGCEKKGDPPALPPAESMMIDFTEFAAVKKSSFLSVENTNWGVAATVAGVWNSLLAVNLAVPVAAFHMAIQNSPEYLDNKTWEWTYSVSAVGATYIARLRGQIKTEEIQWNMYITRMGAGGFTEFEWFSGTTALDGNSGQWILNHSKQFPEPMLRIDWEKTGDEIGSVKYTYVRDLNNERLEDLFKGSYIEYGLTSAALNAFYDVHFYEFTKEKYVDVNIEWSTTAHNGRVKAQDYFQDALWHCWDGNGNDITCPN
jgi:hypothetical protein